MEKDGHKLWFCCIKQGSLLEKTQYRYKIESTNEFFKFIPFFAEIEIFRGYEKWSLAVVIVSFDFGIH